MTAWVLVAFLLGSAAARTPNQVGSDGIVYASAPQERGAYSVGKAGGPYNYGYNTGDGIAKVEVRQKNGAVYGSYRYFDPTGKQVVRTYIADENGFRVLGNDLPISPDTPVSQVVGTPAFTGAVEGTSEFGIPPPRAPGTTQTFTQPQQTSQTFTQPQQTSQTFTQPQQTSQTFTQPQQSTQTISQPQQTYQQEAQFSKAAEVPQTNPFAQEQEAEFQRQLALLEEQREQLKKQQEQLEALQKQLEAQQLLFQQKFLQQNQVKQEISQQVAPQQVAPQQVVQQTAPQQNAKQVHTATVQHRQVSNQLTGGYTSPYFYYPRQYDFDFPAGFAYPGQPAATPEPEPADPPRSSYVIGIAR